MMKSFLSLLRWKFVNFLAFYEYDGDNIPVIQGSALGALNGEGKWVEKFMELMEAVDDWIPEPPA